MSQLLTIFVLIILGSRLNAAVYGFTPFSSDFSTQVSSDQLVVKNMPPVRSQDSIGLCYTFSAAALIEHSICKDRNLDCEKLKADQRPSVISLARYAYNANGLSDKTDPNEYPKQIPNDYALGMAIIQNIFSTKSFTKESCSPFDAIVSLGKDPNSQTAVQTAMWKSLQNSYTEYQKKISCPECALDFATTSANQLTKNYKLKTSNMDILKAFSAGTYEEFLYRVLVPESCVKPDQQSDFYTTHKMPDIWPKETTKNRNYETAIDVIKERLRKQIPVMVNKFCTLEKPTPNCINQTQSGQEYGGHSFVITGYRKMCNKKGECYDALKVHNSWGQQWQDQNNDGWVNAKTLIDRTQYQYAALGWIEPE